MSVEIKEGSDMSTINAENIEASKLEWGSELPKMTWAEAQNKIAELNAGLSERENRWRMPTQSEFEKALNDGSLDRNIYKQYWSINRGAENEPGGHFEYESSGQGRGWMIEEKGECLLRLIRDAA
jgi:formylglycine-generating enzyme required for sulfatase activity